nr:hypothetical protein [Desulfuromonadales bacterium]
MTYFFWAEDLAANGESRRVNSDLRFAEVRHFEEIFREGMAGESAQQQQQQQEGQQGNQSEELIKQQKEVLNATWKLKRLVENNPAQLLEDAPVVQAGQESVIESAAAAGAMVGDSEAGRHLQQALEAMRSAAGELEAISAEDDVPRLDAALGHEQAAYAALLKMRAREFEVQRAQQQSSSSSSSASQRQQRQMQNMELKQEEKRYETQRFAQEQQQEARREATREDLQMLNRLKELARRQGSITDKIKELQAMLEEAQTEEEKEEIRRELERLEEEQRELVEDLDELNERMETGQNRDRTTEERENLDQAREEAQKTAESLENERLDQAANAGTRAEQQFEELADEFRERTSNQFADEMRQARREVRELADKEEEIAGELERRRKEKNPGNEEKDPFTPDQLEKDLAAQQEELGNLLEDLRQLSEQAEEAEPVLSRKLYDAVRETETEGVKDALENARRFARFDRLLEAAEFERAARLGIDELKEGVEQAAESILGNEEAALRMARSEIENLMREVEES